MESLSPKDNDGISDWPCSWEEHELVELREGKRLSLREKLIWLEEMTAFADRIQVSARSGSGENQAKP